MSSRNHLRRLTLLSAGALSLVLALSACGGAKPGQRDDAAAAGAASPAESADAQGRVQEDADESTAPAVAGYQPGEAPPIPEIVLPDFSLLSASAGAFKISSTKSLTSIPGVRVSPAKCNGKGLVSSAGTVLGGDGSGTTRDKDGSQVNGGDGSGVVDNKDAMITNGGDGSGTYTGKKNGVSIVNGGDGTGTYSDKTLRVVIGEDGAGTSEDQATGRKIVLDGKGGGTYEDDENGVKITNDGTGSGTYDDGHISISNDASGQALVTEDDGDAVRVKAEPLAKAPTVGSMPPLASIKPVKSCGTTITLENGVLFDFGKSDLRPEAADTLGKVQKVFDKLKVPAAQVYGHTDSVDTEAFNQKLSEDRAAAVVTGLKDAGATARMESKGYGETKPVAPNTKKDGSDNPAGRQLNRRVEIFVPAF